MKAILQSMVDCFRDQVCTYHSPAFKPQLGLIKFTEQQSRVLCLDCLNEFVEEVYEMGIADGEERCKYED